MNNAPKFSAEVRERTVRMVQERRSTYLSWWLPKRIRFDAGR